MYLGAEITTEDKTFTVDGKSPILTQIDYRINNNSYVETISDADAVSHPAVNTAADTDKGNGNGKETGAKPYLGDTKNKEKKEQTEQKTPQKEPGKNASLQELAFFSKSAAFHRLIQWYRDYKVFSFSSFPAFNKISFVGREKVKILIKKEDIELVSKHMDIYQVIDDDNKILDNNDFLPLRVEEPIGWLFYKWGWLGKYKGGFSTMKLKWSILAKTEGYSFMRKIGYWFKILLNKEY